MVSTDFPVERSKEGKINTNETHRFMVLLTSRYAGSLVVQFFSVCFGANYAEDRCRSEIL